MIVSTTIKNYWVILSSRNNIRIETISCTRKDAIEKFIKDTTFTWEECKKFGWAVKKVNITFQYPE